MEEDADWPCPVIPDQAELFPSLVAYLEGKEISSSGFDQRTKKFTHVTPHGCKRHCGGLKAYLARKYLPMGYEQPRRKRSRSIVYKKKSGTDEIGIRVMKGVEEYVANGGVIPQSYTTTKTKIGKRVLGFLTAITDWLRESGYEMQAAEVPVLFPRLGKMTRADLITKNRQGTDIVVWEIKCGWPPCASSHKLRLNPPLHNVSCAAFNQYYLQAIYTDAGFRKLGLHSDSVKILHCWEEAIECSRKKRRKVEENGKCGNSTADETIVYKVAARDMPRWALDLRKTILPQL